MITCHPITNVTDAAHYHDKAFTQDGIRQSADNYYLNEMAPATWQGKGAAILGIQDKAVTREDFINYLSGKLLNPATGNLQDLANNSRGEDRRLGWDLSIAPPKSVSIVALVGGDQRIIEAHHQANHQAISWLEEHGAFIRVKDSLGRNVNEQTGNLLWATVLHEANRENEPQLHCHNVVTAATYDTVRKKWRSLTNDEIFILRNQADTVYKGKLSQSLRDLGYELTYSKNGRDFEIAGLTKEQIETYSKRTKQIDQALCRRGYDPDTASWSARQIATLDTRTRKQELPREVLKEIWLEQAKETKLDLSSIISNAQQRASSMLYHDKQKSIEAQKSAALDAVSWAVAHLSEREQSFKASLLESTAVKFLRGDIAHVKWAIDHHIKNHLIVEREIEQGKRKKGVRWLTTHKAIDSEMRLQAHITSGKNAGRPILHDSSDFNQELKNFEEKKTAELGATFKLSGEQINAAKNILMHEDNYQGIQGEAGTGKTAALAMVKDVAEKRGWQVLGIATSSSAARELENSSGIKSSTVASFFVEKENAIRLVKAEINELKSVCEERGCLYKKNTTRIETKRLTPETRFNLKFSESRYTFDHERGEVFKLKHGFLNWIGGHLLDTSEKIQTSRISKLPQETLGHHLKIKTIGHIATLSSSIGNAISTYEKVENVEAIAARGALYKAKETEKAQLTSRLYAKEAELDNLIKTGNKEGRKTLIVMDESSMTGTYDAEKISHLAKEIGARVVFQGDIKQHGSIPAGRAFEQAQRAGMNVSILEETRRFDKATKQTKQAIAEMKLGRYREAIEALDRTVVSEAELAQVTAERYLENIESLKQTGNLNPKVGVVVTTNNDRKSINASIHNLLQEKQLIDRKNHAKEHLDDPKMTGAECRHVSELLANRVDRLIARRNYKNLNLSKGEVVTVKNFDVKNNRIHGITESGRKIIINPDKHTKFTPAKLESREYAVGDKVEARENLYPNGNRDQRIPNGARGEILAIDKKNTIIAWWDGQKTVLGNKEMSFVDLAYVRTTFKEQGATNDREIIAISKIGAKVFNKEAAYVAATRAKQNTEIVTSDLKTLLKNSGKDVSKTTAIDIENNPNHTGLSKEKVFDRMMQSILSSTRFKEQEVSKSADSELAHPTRSVVAQKNIQKDISIEQLLQK